MTLCNKVPGASEAKKLLSVLATSTPITETRDQTVETDEIVETAKDVETVGTSKDGKKSESGYPENLVQVLCIRYPINFGKKSVSALFDLGSEVNAVYPAFAKELGLSIRSINFKAQKIDGTTIDIFGIVVVAFLVMDKANRVRFFEETYLVANMNPKVVFGMIFFTLNGADIDFLGW